MLDKSQKGRPDDSATVGGASPGGPGTVSRRGVLRFGAVGIAAAAGSPILAACGGRGAKSGAGKTLTVLVGKNTTAAEGQQRIFEAIRTRFEAAHPGATVRFDVVPLGAAVSNRLITSAASRQGPDIFDVGPTLLPTGQAADALEPITDSVWSSLGGKDRFLPPALAVAGPTPDHLLAIPCFGSTMAMYYNKKMYQDAGIGAPPTSWSDFVQVGKQLTAGGRFGVGEAASEPPHAWHVLWLLTTQLGGRLISADGKQALLDSPPVLQAATSWLDWMAKYKIVNTGDVTHGWAEQTTQFIARKSAMFPFGFQSVMSSLANTGISDEWSLAANPTIPYGMNAIPGGGKPAQTFLGGNLWAIFKHGKNKDLAFELAKIMTSPDIQYMYWKELSGLPVTQDTYTQHPEAKQGVWKVLYDAALNAEPLPWTPAFGQVSPLLAAAVKPSFAEMSGGGNYNLADLKAQLTTANQKLAEALKSQR